MSAVFDTELDYWLFKCFSLLFHTANVQNFVNLELLHR